MHFVADFHLHSKYSRAVSPNMTIPVMEKFARQKGIDILTVSDWTHPIWFKEIQNLLEEAGEGIYRLRSEISNSKFPISNDKKDVLFIFSTEISSIYKEAGKLRRIHNLVFAPNIETAKKINNELIKRGCNLSADGRPIVGISSKNLLELILSIDERCLLIPCHVWTPHFGIYGSASGYDSLSEAFGEMSKYIYGIETGLSSDPDMNWQIEELKNRSILSFSDAHSAPKLAREATVFDLEAPNYENIRQAIMRPMKAGERTSNRIVYTIEFYPEEGKYHFSGHRNCKVVYGPEEIRDKGVICPICNKRLTEGVLLRVQQLSSQKLLNRAKSRENGKGLKWYTDNMHLQPPFVKLVPLVEIIAEGLGVTQSSQKVPEMYEKMTAELDSEINILLKTDIKEIEKIAHSAGSLQSGGQAGQGNRIAQGVEKVREGQIIIDPGYDGVFGKVKIWSGEEQLEKPDTPQLSLDI